MLDKKRNDVIKVHLKLSKTLKELKRVLPSGYIKTNIFSARVNPIKHQPTLINLKKTNNINNNYNSKEITINQSKNIYMFSEGNNQSKKNITKLSNYFTIDKQMNNLHSFKNDNNLSEKGYITPRVAKTIKIPTIIKDNRIMLNMLKRKNKIKSNSKLFINDIKLNYEFNTTRKNFKGLSIDNSLLKNNIDLPSITERLKSNLPRYDRQKFGLLLKNIRTNYIKNINKNTLGKGIKTNKKYKVIKFNKSFNVKFKKNKSNTEKKEILESNSFFKKFKSDDIVEIKSIKKIKREMN